MLVWLWLHFARGDQSCRRSVVNGYLMHARSSAARGHSAQRLRHVVPVLSALSLAPLLAGCFVNTEKPELAVDIPEHYRFAGAGPEANLPALDWWRGFRSPELTQLIEEAQTSNLDIAVAVARIMQADAQARIAGAPLLPNISGVATAAHSLAPVTGGATTVTNTGAAAGGGSTSSVSGGAVAQSAGNAYRTFASASSDLLT